MTKPAIHGARPRLDIDRGGPHRDRCPIQPGGSAIETLVGICMGIGLAAAVGFRLFIPPLLMGLAAAFGLVELPGSLDWLGSGIALTAFGTASVLELAAYAIPWLDNLLDTVATPLAVVAGTLLAAGFLTDLPPTLQWTLAIIAGGGASAATQAATTAGRGASTATTAGLANPIVSAGEATASAVTTAISLFVPILAASLVTLLGVWVFVRVTRSRRQNNPET